MIYNFVLEIILLLSVFIGITIIHRKFGLYGLFALVPVVAILANIQIVKMISFFGLACSMGNILYSSSFLITDIISELYGEKYGKKAIKLGISCFFLTTIVMQICLFVVPSSLDASQPHLNFIFGLLPRIFFFSTLSYMICNYLDVVIYSKIKKRFPKYLWVRNNVATMVSQFLDTVIISFGFYLGILPIKEIFEIMITTYLVKWLVAICDTPFLYYNKKKGKVKNV